VIEAVGRGIRAPTPAVVYWRHSMNDARHPSPAKRELNAGLNAEDRE
jgi:hypothetical protein